MNTPTRISTFFIVLCVLSVNLFVIPTAFATELLEPTLSINIPGVDFKLSEAEIDGNTLRINFLATYINGIYKYLIGISTTIAIVMMMVAGLQWALSGSVEEMASKAKERMKNAATGLILLMCTYLILATVNPNLVLLRFPELQNIDYSPLINESGDGSGSATWAEITAKLEELGVMCGGVDVGLLEEEEIQSVDTSVESIASAFVGKVTYRFDAKGGEPPYSGEGRKETGGQRTADFCPENTICTDCSGFVDILRQCAGLSSLNESGGTAGIFSGAEQLTHCAEDGIVSTQAESFTLNPGDLVGFRPGDREDQPGFGHVWMYIGRGRVISAMGGATGRTAGNSVAIDSLQSICKNYPLRLRQR